MDTTTTSSLDLLLQNGLEITAEGRCARHPEAFLVSKGEITSCSVCTAEQESGLFKSLNDSLRTGSLRTYSQVGNIRPDFELGMSLSKVVSGGHESFQDVSSIGRSNQRSNSNINHHHHSDQTLKTNTVGNGEDGEGDELLQESQHEHEDGSVTGMEKLIARWCQLQDTSSKPNNEMLSSTLILLQLQKLERRVQHQENAIHDLSYNMQEQQSTIQGDLTRILSFVSAAANNGSMNMSQQHQQSNSNGNHYNSHHEPHPLSNGNHYKNSASAPPLQVNTNHSAYHPAGATAASAISGLSGSAEEYSSHMSQSQAPSLQGGSAAPPTRPPTSGEMKEIVLSPQSDYNRTSMNSLHPSSVFTSVRTVERQPPKPPKRHDSLQSIRSRKSDISSMSSNITGHYHPQDQLPVQPPTIFVPPPATETTGPPPPIEIEKPQTADSAANSATQAPGPLGLTKKNSRSSFRSQRSQTKPQLDIIWDASDHTTGSALNQVANKNTPNQNKNDLRNFNANSGGGGGKRAPTLSFSLDDDDDDDDDDRSAKLFMAVKGYMDDGGPPKLAPISNHDSCLNFLNNASSLTGVDSFMDDLVEDDKDNSGNSGNNDLEMIDQERTEFMNGAVPYIAESTDDDDEDDTETEEFEPSGESNEFEANEESNKSGSGKKSKKKGWKKSKKKEKKEKKNSKKQNGHTVIINNKVSPSQSLAEGEKAHHKRTKVRKFSAKAKIFWKRGSKENNNSDSEASNIKTELQKSEKQATPRRSFSFVDDNPRSHSGQLLLDNSGDSKPTRASSRSFDETYTVRTQMTAKTPLENIIRDNTYFDPPPPPQANRGRQNYRQSHSSDERTHNHSTIATSAATLNHGSSATSKMRNDNNASSSPSARRQRVFPRTRGMMPTLVNSKREIVIAGESSRMQISTLTLDTALPSADAGSMLEEVTNKSITDKCKERGTFTGTVNETDDPEGFGTMIYISGAFYKGYWKEGHWHGHGILRTPNGDSYEGDFVYDCRHGRGIYKYENGDVYEGDFSSDKRHGKGTFLFQSGSMYRGDFAFGNFHGYGWYEFEEGYYEGSWVEGVYEGIGSLSYKDGSHYTGRFKEGVADGMGEEVKPDGTKKRGIWRSGEFLGQEEDDQHAPQGPLDSSGLSV